MTPMLCLGSDERATRWTTSSTDSSVVSTERSSSRVIDDSITPDSASVAIRVLGHRFANAPTGSTARRATLRGGRLDHDDRSSGHPSRCSPASSSPAPLLRLRARVGRRGGSSPPSQYPSLYVGRAQCRPRSAFASTRTAIDPLGMCASTASTFARGCISASIRWPRARKLSRWSRNSPGACAIVATRCTEATEPGSTARMVVEVPAPPA
jgi:hypothetical protein